MKLPLLTWTLLLAGALSLQAQEDITATYVANPSFEQDSPSSLTAVTNSADGLRGYTLASPAGWTVSGTGVTQLLVTKDCYTDNNFGKVTTLADSSQAYYLRMGWSTGQTVLSQTLANLPKGNYQLQASVRAAYANQAVSTYRLSAGDAATSGSFDTGSTGCFTSMAWKTVSVGFTQAEDGNATIALTVDWLSGGSCIMVDNVRLLQVGEGDDPQPVVESPTEDVITADFVDESHLTYGLIQMLANFATYLKNDFQDCAAPNSVGEECGCFKSNSTMQNNEDGVRSNADLGMICAFLLKYGKRLVTLPSGVTWDDIEKMAMKSLVFAYSTHKANKLKVCSGNNYWGSTSASDHVWESSLWAMSVGYSAFFLWDKLSDAQKGYIEKLIKAECNYELERTILTGYAGDTKAEENGWEACVLAVALGLYPNDALAEKWYARLREFAINSYSHPDDATDQTVIDSNYDETTVADLYKGPNLYPDYTLQNHNYFHTSYQNVVIQELGEAALAMKLFQTTLWRGEKWKTKALMHNNLKVQQEVLNWLALADGELAMPNGNDWSLFLYDQITSYSTNACFLRDADALMLENLAYKYIQARQTTTTDGSWLLRSDIGARRMGVEAHRVMMSYLMHLAMPTSEMTPTKFEDFRQRHSQAKVFETQNIVRAYSPDRFTTFSWSAGLNSYTGYVAANSVDKNKIVVPFKANNTGNLLGWYTVSGKGTNATPVVRGIYDLQGDAWTMNGELNTNDAALNNRFAIFSTPGNAVIYQDLVRANTAATVSREQGGLLAVSTDEFTRLSRTLYYGKDGSPTVSQKSGDGSAFQSFSADWVNIDGALGVVAKGDKKMGFGDRANNNSIMTAKLYTSYDDASRQVTAHEVVDKRQIIYYSNITAEETSRMSEAVIDLREQVPMGWNGLMAADPDGTMYLLLSNFVSDEQCTLEQVETPYGYPVFSVPTEAGRTTFVAEMNHSVSNTVKFFSHDTGLQTRQEEGNPLTAYFRNTGGEAQEYTVSVVTSEGLKDVTFTTDDCVKLTIDGAEVLVEGATFPFSDDDDLTAGYDDLTETALENHNFEDDATYGTEGSATIDAGTYNPCYVNDVAAADSKWPNILPVKGWQAGNGLSGGSNFCRMYSMPYSTTLYCVSPKGVGNYAAQTAGMVADTGKGRRALTVLNSWDSGRNAISQDVTLEAATYRVIMDMKYECTNQTSNDGKVVRTSGGNVNTSLTGVTTPTGNDYRYPDKPNEWQTMVFDFTLDATATVTLSVGYQSSASQGAANNTVLYVDNVRLLKKTATAINMKNHDETDGNQSVYNLSGMRVKGDNLPQGVYVKGKKKFVVR